MNRSQAKLIGELGPPVGGGFCPTRLVFILGGIWLKGIGLNHFPTAGAP